MWGFCCKIPGSVADRSRLCPERLLRVRTLSDAVRNYSDIVSKLHDLVGQGLHSETQVLQRQCRSVWQMVEVARLALYRHEANHCCNRPDFELERISDGT